MIRFCRKIVHHRLFENIVNTVIVFSGIQLGLETFPETHKIYGSWFDAIDNSIMIIFACELLMRIGAVGFNPHLFLKNRWNVLDLLVVVLPLLPITGHYQTFAKAIRVFRILRLLKLIPELKLLMQSITGSARYILSISILLGLFFYAYSVAGVVMFGKNDVVHFHDLATSMLTMFRVVTLEDWTDIMYINMYGCNTYGYEVNPELCITPEGHPLEAALFFVSFVCLGTMIILNLFIAVIVESISAVKMAKSGAEEETIATDKDLLRQLHEVSAQLDRIKQNISK